MRLKHPLALALALVATTRPGLAGADVGARPNIVLILADDLGWADVGCNGGDLVETPAIDRLASEGVRFTQAYAPAPVCSPTRAAILTGKAPARLQITIWSEGAAQGPGRRKLVAAESLPDLPHEEATLAEHLRSAGYLTALVGKWHLGDADHAPETQGFDVNIGGTHWGAPQTFWWPYRGAGRFGSEYRYVPHLEFGREGEYLTDRLTDEAIRVIDHARSEDFPFFLDLAHHAPHTPIEAKPDRVAAAEGRLRPEMDHRNPVYAAMVTSLDESVGRIIEHLRVKGLDKNTIVVFTSDNGGYIGVDRKAGQAVPVTNNAPLRSGKGSCYEGGLRVPLIVRWPGLTGAGRTCDEPVVLTDLFPTLLAAAGVPLPAGVHCDGLDLAALLADPGSRLDRDALFFHYPHYYETTTPVSAVRAGDWKLLHYFEDDRVELYNLADDPGESADLAAREPSRSAGLRARLDAWLQSVGAAFPGPNPNAQAGRGRDAR